MKLCLVCGWAAGLMPTLGAYANRPARLSDGFPALPPFFVEANARLETHGDLISFRALIDGGYTAATRPDNGAAAHDGVSPAPPVHLGGFIQIVGRELTSGDLSAALRRVVEVNPTYPSVMFLAPRASVIVVLTTCMAGILGLFLWAGGLERSVRADITIPSG